MGKDREYKIKARPTQFGEHTFRSVLEVRWAVFFQSMGWAFEYEPKLFDFGSVRYLPDFYLPEFHMWAEVKPDTLTDWEAEKVRRLTYYTDEPCLLLDHTPSEAGYTLVMPDESLRPVRLWTMPELNGFIDGAWTPATMYDATQRIAKKYHILACDGQFNTYVEGQRNKCRMAVTYARRVRLHDDWRRIPATLVLEQLYGENPQLR